MKRYELKLNSAKKDLRNIMPERYIEAFGYQEELNKELPEGFNFSDLSTSFSSAFRAYHIVKNDIYGVLYKAPKHSTDEYTSFGSLNWCINFVVDYVSNLVQYFKDMLLYPMGLFLSYVVFHLCVEPFLRLFKGEFNDEEFWDFPNVKDQPWYHIFFNTLAWVFLKVPFDIIGHMIEIVIGAILAVTGIFTIAAGTFLDRYFEEAPQVPNPEEGSKKGYTLDQINEFIRCKLIIEDDYFELGYGNILKVKDEHKSEDLKFLSLGTKSNQEDFEGFAGFEDLEKLWANLYKEHKALDEQDQSFGHLLAQFAASINFNHEATQSNISDISLFDSREDTKASRESSRLTSREDSKQTSLDSSTHNRSPGPENMDSTEAFEAAINGIDNKTTQR